ncbi:histidine phosphatase superfamily [Fomitopsis serialis]|uniref:histidine phosphatase superfamily n=1 Tax=Fomitopsis serialis TaxID=139415 RepID=UPI002007D1E3|nr:histidine phosphatase superfamily [Neoantrodia serialis]KAH9919703.1 histidine phosphatase superfamily [Neoantrodia serialis]
MSKSKRNSLGTGNGFLPAPATAVHPGHYHKHLRFAQHAAPCRPIQVPRIPRPRMTTLFLVALAFYAICGYVTLGRPSAPEAAHVEAENTESNLTSDRSIFGADSMRWAQYAPYFPVQPYVAPPKGCDVDQVHILQRHGARYPTTGAAARIQAALAKLHAVTVLSNSPLAFVSNYTYTLGQNSLVSLGAQESYDSGKEVYTRYAPLVDAENLPFVRASGSERVEQSATNWTAGFAAASSGVYAPTLSVVISEESNDTLDDSSCPRHKSSSLPDAYIDIYAANFTAALNAGAPGANLHNADTHALVTLCMFESVAREERSAWCDLFAELGAWDGFEYWADLDKYYGTGYGNPLGPVQGVGYVNELLARLTSTPVSDSTSTNRTLDAAPATFPLNRTVYADFSHDNLMVPVFAALGLFPTDPLDPASGAGGVWNVSRMVPFAGRMVVERLTCGEGDASDDEEGRYVRVLVNEAVQPLAFCGARGDGVCGLDAFVESQAFARSGGNGTWGACFESDS